MGTFSPYRIIRDKRNKKYVKTLLTKTEKYDNI
nr:MAG TPA: hypothetical protein [Caudoviricetes sp.]